MSIYLILLATLLLIALLASRRVDAVYAYRKYLIDAIHERNIRDIDKGIEYEWRWEYYETVSYDDMMMKFWKPLDSFYKEKDFIK